MYSFLFHLTNYSNYDSSVIWARRVVKTLCKTSEIEECSLRVLGGDLNGGLEDSFDFLLDLVHALLSFSKAKRAALSGTSGAASPANWSKSPSLVVALGITEEEFLILILFAGQWMAHATSLGLLVASQS